MEVVPDFALSKTTQFDETDARNAPAFGSQGALPCQVAVQF